jgi:hypothetical protein
LEEYSERYSVTSDNIQYPQCHGPSGTCRIICEDKIQNQAWWGFLWLVRAMKCNLRVTATVQQQALPQPMMKHTLRFQIGKYLLSASIFLDIVPRVNDLY